jgi:hypothetical protein
MAAARKRPKNHTHAAAQAMTGAVEAHLLDFPPAPERAHAEKPAAARSQLRLVKDAG